MAVGSVLNIIIGLVFAYFLLALIASGVQEVFASVFAWRGTYLSKGIDVIIDNNPDAAWHWSSIREFLKAHLTPGAPPTAAERLKARLGDRPPDPQEAALARVLSVHSHPLVRSSPTALPSYVSSRNFALALLETLRDGSQAPLFAQAEHTVAELPDGDLKRTLTLFLQNSGGDIDKLRNFVERWFDDAMDRLSGIYKRISQYVVLGLGLCIAIILNVDSTRMARTLWAQPAVLSAITADASSWGQQKGTPSIAGSCQNDQSGSVETAVTCFEDESFPVGWSEHSFSRWTVPGWIITALAVGLGAPFWFSLLQQLTNLRNAGPAPPRATDSSGTPPLTSS